MKKGKRVLALVERKEETTSEDRNLYMDTVSASTIGRRKRWKKRGLQCKKERKKREEATIKKDSLKEHE